MPFDRPRGRKPSTPGLRLAVVHRRFHDAKDVARNPGLAAAPPADTSDGTEPPQRFCPAQKVSSSLIGEAELLGRFHRDEGVGDNQLDESGQVGAVLCRYPTVFLP